jgi:hypothetical protein
VNALQIHLAEVWESRAVLRRSHSWQLAVDRRGMCVVVGVRRDVGSVEHSHIGIVQAKGFF